MTTYGLGPNGFTPKPLAQILADIQTYQQANINANLDVQPTALMGQINSIYANHISELWQLANALYSGMDPANAVADQLASVSAITGTLKKGATSTEVLCTVVVAAGFIAQPGTMFANPTGNTLNLFYNLTIVDNSLGITPATFYVYFICQDTGPIQVAAGAMVNITIPLTGWTSITNANAGLAGTNIETDPFLRIRRTEELSKSSCATSAALQSQIFAQMQPPTTQLQTTNVVVLTNDTDVTDGNGLPPHSFECIALLLGGASSASDDQLLANLIASIKTAGDNTHGTTTLTVTDSQGIGYPLSFTRPSLERLYAAITVTCVTAAFVYGPVSTPTSTAGQVAAALAAVVSASVPGSTVYAKKIADGSFTVAGVNDWTAFAIDTVSTPVNTGNLSTNVRTVPQLAVSDITVTVNLV